MIQNTNHIYYAGSFMLFVVLLMVSYVVRNEYVVRIDYEQSRKMQVMVELENERLKKRSEDRLYPFIKRNKTDNFYFKKFLEANYTTDRQVLEHIVHPFSGYVVCDYFLGTEVWKHRVNINMTGKIDLEKVSDFHSIKNNSFVMVQVDKITMFVKHVLPKLHVQIILITGQWFLPQLKKSKVTDSILASEKIIKWFSQNPIWEYRDETKYHVFPFGIRHDDCLRYYNFLLTTKIDKKIYLSNMHCSVHKHLNKNHIRKMFPMLCNAAKIKYDDFLLKVSQSKFLVSTAGDRPDCYRHYEAIGLGTKPVSDIAFLYRNIFGSNMVYLNRTSLVNAVKYKTFHFRYEEVNRDLITLAYWQEWMKTIT